MYWHFLFCTIVIKAKKYSEPDNVEIVSFEFLLEHKFIIFELKMFINFRIAFSKFVKFVEDEIESNQRPSSSTVFGVHNNGIKNDLVQISRHMEI